MITASKRLSVEESGHGYSVQDKGPNWDSPGAGSGEAIQETIRVGGQFGVPFCQSTDHTPRT